MSTQPVRSITRSATGRPLAELPYDPEQAPDGPRRGEWDRCEAFLEKLSGIGVPHADAFVMTHRDLKFGAVHQFFGTICPDPMLSGTRPKRTTRTGKRSTRAEKQAAKGVKPESTADKERRLLRERREALGLKRTRTVEEQILDPHEDDLPNSLPDALNEFAQLEEGHQSRALTALAEHIQRELGLCEGCAAPRLPAWADRNRMLLGQRAFMTNLLPAVLVLLCKSLPEAYSAGRPAAVLMLSGELSDLPYHRLIGTMQLLVTVSTPYSFEGPWYPAFVAAEEMQLLHAGVRMNVAPRLATPQQQPVDRGKGGWAGQNYQVWPGYGAFTRGWPRSDAGNSRQVVVSQTDMLATIIAFSVLVIDGLKTFGTPMTDEEADAYWHLWRVFAVLKGIHPPGKPHDGSWVPETLHDAREFWQTYRRLYLCGPSTREGNWLAKAREDNPAGCALTSAHLYMIAKMLRHWLPYAPVSEARWLKIVRWYVELLSGEEGAARVGVPATGLGRFWKWVAWKLPRTLEGLLDKLDPNLHVALSSFLLVSLVNQEYGTRLVFPVPQTLGDLTQANQSSIREKLAARLQQRVFMQSDDDA